MSIEIEKKQGLTTHCLLLQVFNLFKYSQKAKNESQESATETEEIQPIKKRSFRKIKQAKKSENSDDNTSSNEQKSATKSPPKIVVHKSKKMDQNLGM